MPLTYPWILPVFKSLTVLSDYANTNITATKDFFSSHITYSESEEYVAQKYCDSPVF